MVAIYRFNIFPDGEYLAKLIRRLLGGRVLIMSEYAARMVQAIDELVGLAERHNSPRSAFNSDIFDRVLELDGQIEALRIRLGIENLPTESSLRLSDKLGWTLVEEKPVGRTDPDDFASGYEVTHISGNYAFFGFTKLCLFEVGGGFLETYGEVCCFMTDKSNWLTRMKSFRAIAQELSTAPQLDSDEEDIMQLLVGVNRRLTTTQILTELESRQKIKGESTVKMKLAGLTKRGILNNRSDTNPKGYGLPAWQ